VQPSRAATVIASGLSVVLLLGAGAQRWPYGYYTLLRLVVCGTALHLTLAALKARRLGVTMVLGLTAALFNPIFSVRMRRADWTPFDPAEAVVIAVATFLVVRRTRS
jgi:hypothetical protein